MSDTWECECGLSDCVYCLTRRAETAEARIAQLESDDVESAKEVDAYRIASESHLTRIAALEAQLAEREWRPIETAPKDGSYVLLSNRASAGMYIGCWVASMSEWIDEIGNWLDPTDWQSLPPPPREML